MRLVDWWLAVPERIAPKIPTIVKAALVPWLLLGLLIAFIPDLQKMPDGLRMLIGMPAALGILWMALGLFLSILDWGIRVGSKLWGKSHG